MSGAAPPRPASPAAPAPHTPAPAARPRTSGGLGALRNAMHAEWTKLRTVPGTAGLLVGVIAATIAVSAAADAGARCEAGLPCSVDTVRLTLAGIQLGQAVVAIMAVLAISSEYSSGMIRVTLTALPRRPVMLAAKAAVVTSLVLVSGTIAVAGSLLTGRLILPGNGFTAARGFPLLSVADGPTLRAAAGSVLYLALIGLLSLGVAAAIRDTAAAIGVVLGLLYLVPIIAHVVGTHWYRHLEQIGPMPAGLAIQVTTGLRSLPLSPWAGLGVLAAWAAGAMLAGGLLLQFRDA